MTYFVWGELTDMLIGHRAPVSGHQVGGEGLSSLVAVAAVAPGVTGAICTASHPAR